MAKNNIRSIRFSDELADLIEQQIGDTFTQKFESLIYRAFWELPAKEKQLEEIKKNIEIQKIKLQHLNEAVSTMEILEDDIKKAKRNLQYIIAETDGIKRNVDKAEA